MSKSTERPDLINAVFWIPGDFDTNGNKFEHGERIVIPRHLFDQAGWTYSIMSERLGFPVKFRRVREHDYDLPDEIPVRRNNNLACILDLNVNFFDLTKVGLRLSEDRFLDEVIFVRQDGGPLQVQHMTALWAFATLHVNELVHFPRESYRNSFPVAEIGPFAAQFLPKSFARVFGDLCAGLLWQEKVIESTPVPKWYEGIESPVLELCGTCCKDRTPDGKALQVCSKCRRRRYCSKECQVTDHPRRKRYCRKS